MDDRTVAELVAACLEDLAEPIEHVDARAARLATDPVIVWEGDAQTFQFSFVSSSAERLLGYPVRRWVDEPTFWADVVIAPDDRDEAIAYCALATAKRADHVFEYRARRSDGGVLWLRDYVRVIVGPRKVATKLRGIMFDVSAERAITDGVEQRSTFRVPSHGELASLE
jgi:PAS domain-containing protein